MPHKPWNEGCYTSSKTSFFFSCGKAWHNAWTMRCQLCLHIRHGQCFSSWALLRLTRLLLSGFMDPMPRWYGGASCNCWAEVTTSPEMRGDLSSTHLLGQCSTQRSGHQMGPQSSITPGMMSVLSAHCSSPAFSLNITFLASKRGP